MYTISLKQLLCLVIGFITFGVGLGAFLMGLYATSQFRAIRKQLCQSNERLRMVLDLDR